MRRRKEGIITLKTMHCSRRKQVKTMDTCRQSTIAQADHKLNSRPETKYFPLPSNATDVTQFV